MSGIIGVTVGTPTSPAKMKDEIKPVLMVNGTKPDATGNVNVSGGGGGGGGGSGSVLPSVTAADNGKVLQVVNGAWAAASLAAYRGEYEVVT